MEHSIKNQRIDDNIETQIGLKSVLVNWVKSINLPFGSEIIDIEDIHFKSCDGFMPHPWNRGGVDLVQIQPTSSIIGNGEHYRLVCEIDINNSWIETLDYIEEENTDLSEDEIWDIALNNGDDSVAYHVRCMYEGVDLNGVGLVAIYAGFDMDSPYFRWTQKSDFEVRVKFKTIFDLKQKLNKITKKLEKSQRKPKK